jgi:hypothetical protein
VELRWWSTGPPPDTRGLCTDVAPLISQPSKPYMVPCHAFHMPFHDASIDALCQLPRRHLGNSRGLEKSNPGLPILPNRKFDMGFQLQQGNSPAKAC